MIKADVIHQLEEAGFEVDAEEPVLKGKMEEFKKRFDAVLLILSVEGFAQYNVMRVKWNLPIKQPWYMSEVPTIVASLTYPLLFQFQSNCEDSALSLLESEISRT